MTFRAYRAFYKWGSIVRGAAAHGNVAAGVRHLVYAAGWKKFEPCWDLIIRAKRAGMMLPVLETILSEFGKRAPRAAERIGGTGTVADIDSLETALTQVIQIQARRV